ncbi:hypothetical protein [Sphingobium nicotianae]|uniref:hypothetical protein n=1 Tax=Sphingobium nicotianae TaxID=2782607 RepID=UPI001BE4B49E|nr:hypothetical protein [Sphingobium nicotianae]
MMKNIVFQTLDLRNFMNIRRVVHGSDEKFALTEYKPLDFLDFLDDAKERGSRNFTPLHTGRRFDRTEGQKKKSRPEERLFSCQWDQRTLQRTRGPP